MANEVSQPTGFFGVLNNLAGSASKIAEAVSDVRAARGETQVVALPATPTPPNTTPGTVPGDVSEAEIDAAGRRRMVAVSDAQKYIIAGAAILGAVALVWIVSRKR